jgi:ribosomal protein L29
MERIMSELSKKTENNLTTEIAEKRKALREIRFSFAGSKNRNVREARTIKRDIARRLTELNERTKGIDKVDSK